MLLRYSDPERRVKEASGELERARQEAEKREKAGKRSTLSSSDNRVHAVVAKRAGVSPATAQRVLAEKKADPEAFEENLRRRHLDASQRAMVAAGLVPLFAEEAKERQRATQNNDAGRAVRAKLPEQADTGRAREKAAAAVNVSSREVLRSAGSGGAKAGARSPPGAVAVLLAWTIDSGRPELQLHDHDRVRLIHVRP